MGHFDVTLGPLYDKKKTFYLIATSFYVQKSVLSQKNWKQNLIFYNPLEQCAVVLGLTDLECKVL